MRRNVPGNVRGRGGNGGPPASHRAGPPGGPRQLAPRVRRVPVGVHRPRRPRVRRPLLPALHHPLGAAAAGTNMGVPTNPHVRTERFLSPASVNEPMWTQRRGTRHRRRGGLRNWWSGGWPSLQKWEGICPEARQAPAEMDRCLGTTFQDPAGILHAPPPVSRSLGHENTAPKWPASISLRHFQLCPPRCSPAVWSPPSRGHS